MDISHNVCWDVGPLELSKSRSFVACFCTLDFKIVKAAVFTRFGRSTSKSAPTLTVLTLLISKSLTHDQFSYFFKVEHPKMFRHRQFFDTLHFQIVKARGVFTGFGSSTSKSAPTLTVLDAFEFQIAFPRLGHLCHIFVFQLVSQLVSLLVSFCWMMRPPFRGLGSPCLSLPVHMCAFVGWYVRLPKPCRPCLPACLPSCLPSRLSSCFALLDGVSTLSPS